jgi:hypothetical protein
MSVSLAKHGRNSAECAMAATFVVGERFKARTRIGGAIGTVRVMPPRSPGLSLRFWFSHDVDPGFGPMAYELPSCHWARLES